MNREIKFRIWADNKFYNKCLVGNTNNTNDKKWTCPMVWLEKSKKWVHCDNGIICQYTGLHDKNGKEIYEGDIVKIYGHCFDFGFKQEEIGQIEFIHGAFGFYREKSKNEYCFNNLETEESYGELDYYEVIGNIYDNPELLGGK